MGIVQDYKEAIQEANREPMGHPGEQLHKIMWIGQAFKEAVLQANPALGREPTGRWWEEVDKLASVAQSPHEHRLAELVAETRAEQKRMHQTYCLDHPWIDGTRMTSFLDRPWVKQQPDAGTTASGSPATEQGADFSVPPWVERFDRRGTEPFELFRSEFAQNSSVKIL